MMNYEYVLVVGFMLGGVSSMKMYTHLVCVLVSFELIGLSLYLLVVSVVGGGWGVMMSLIIGMVVGESIVGLCMLMFLSRVIGVDSLGLIGIMQ